MTNFFLEGQRPTASQHVLIADIGGGTSDINFYTIEEDDGKSVRECTCLPLCSRRQAG